MERIEYDPEIDPSIREEREAAERERELTARIRLEIERYVEDRVRSERTDEITDGGLSVPHSGTQEKADGDNDHNADPEPITAKRPKRAAARNAGRTVQSVFSGSILSSDWMRKMWPYLLGIAALLVLYIAHTFHLQKLHLEQQNLEREVRELSIKAVAKTAEKVRNTRRSEIVKRLEEKHIPLEEFPHPVKTIKRR